MAKANSTQQLRIIGGQWRGRKFNFASADGLRPTGDRIRETLFNWLSADIHGARCLDLFSGSGALALEALSRGASAVELWEHNSTACALLKKHLQSMAEQMPQQQARVVQGDTLQNLKAGNPSKPFDIVFMDPPFAAGFWESSAELLEQHGWLHPDSLIYVESPRDNLPKLPNNWRNWRCKNSGQVCYQLFIAGELPNN
ncbi:16S rRNA (guanine(966)-N(2))-methyltransferase RsmD [Pseudoteredinibacter isoporae]|uniref:Ribosomal RNA small subunit methyltransferase D n=1 Tax=Pseudoteredinibacter isoporae TaxID=570281 RepID=A0A7X0MUL9_9GAMM|nr:16S rRNA (guanine(966)-N(2))-methyltransferase RsmD [Pseudoteredinibacter isoporae]MBB6520428.1 16S rRNA (guanine966-N2)-methyltransferase [Pseudoteredinibacter isoporae]NHO85996.1 16S rRNA (guanine(966)-N(2))-methyltransferase RsmD [Pseudoteredinibacter isoporae]NIB25553.1 16S rRNA (guanine(966)-N(2))-methyltransferase RsmD [Pseudoteredinibacter isoporae]